MFLTNLFQQRRQRVLTERLRRYATVEAYAPAPKQPESRYTFEYAGFGDRAYITERGAGYLDGLADGFAALQPLVAAAEEVAKTARGE